MLKTFKDLCPEESPEEVLLDYALDQFGEGEWPASVVLAILEMDHPDRTFAIDCDDDDLVDSDDAVDVTEGIEVVEARKKEVAALEDRLEKLKRQLAGG